MLVRLHTIPLPILHLRSDFFLGAAIPKPWFPCWMPRALNLPTKNPSYVYSKNANVWAYPEEKRLKGPSWYSGCHISHLNELWSIKQLIHTVCLCRPQRNSWASRIITCTLLPSCPQHMVQGTDTKSREGQPKDSRALETNLESCFTEWGDSGHVLCSLTSNINNPVTDWWYSWSFRRRDRRMTPPGRKVRLFKE